LLFTGQSARWCIQRTRASFLDVM